MRDIVTQVYKFSELSESAKDNARQWWRDSMDSSDYSESVIEDAMQVAGILGIEIATRPVKLMGGATRKDPAIYWSGFCSQGDGACFEGLYSYRKGSCKAIRAYAPMDTELHDIADSLFAWQKVNFYRLQAKMQHSRGNNMAVDVPVEGIADQMRAFANWIYRNLEKEHEWMTSNEQIDESIECNDYEFTVKGAIA